MIRELKVESQVYESYMDMINELQKVKTQIDIAIQGLEAIIQSGQINIADVTLEAIKDVGGDNNIDVYDSDKAV